MRIKLFRVVISLHKDFNFGKRKFRIGLGYLKDGFLLREKYFWFGT